MEKCDLCIITYTNFPKRIKMYFIIINKPKLFTNDENLHFKILRFLKVRIEITINLLSFFSKVFADFWSKPSQSFIN